MCNGNGVHWSLVNWYTGEVTGRRKKKVIFDVPIPHHIKSSAQPPRHLPDDWYQEPAQLCQSHTSYYPCYSWKLHSLVSLCSLPRMQLQMQRSQGIRCLREKVVSYHPKSRIFSLYFHYLNYKWKDLVLTIKLLSYSLLAANIIFCFYAWYRFAYGHDSVGLNGFSKLVLLCLIYLLHVYVHPRKLNSLNWFIITQADGWSLHHSTMKRNPSCLV